MIKLTDAALYYKEESQQVEAFSWLQTQIDPTTLEIFGQKYRDKPKVPSENPLQVPYQSQNDNESGTGYRECFSSSMAMIAMYWGKVNSDDEYNRIRSKYGEDSTLLLLPMLPHRPYEMRLITPVLLGLAGCIMGLVAPQPVAVIGLLLLVITMMGLL